MSEYLVRVNSKAPAGRSSLQVPVADDSHYYAATRALSFWPMCNANNYTWEREKLAPLIGTDNGFKVGLANLNHNIGPRAGFNQIIGAVCDEAVVGDGVDLIAKIDRRAAAVYDAKPEDFATGGEYCDSSVEIWCAADGSEFIAMTNPGSPNKADQVVFSAAEAAAAGVRRTDFTENAPYYYEGRYVVVESPQPLKCRGIAFLDDPADPTANVFEVAAKMNKSAKGENGIEHPYGTGIAYADPGFLGKKARYPVDTPSHTRAAASYFGMPKNREKYSPDQQAHIAREIADAKRKFGIGEVAASLDYGDDSDAADSSVASIARYYDSAPDAGSIDGDMDGEAYADYAYDPFEVTESKDYPLYASADDHANGRPNHGLVKAAVSAYQAGKLPNKMRSAHKILVAHKQLHNGDNPMEDATLTAELATLKTQYAEALANVNTVSASVAEKDTEIANLKTELQAKADEISAKEAELQAAKGQIEAHAATERANTRLAELAKIEGFAVKDDAREELIASLKTEDDASFEKRLLTEENASLKRQVAAGVKPAQVDAGTQRAEVIAAAAAGLDISPSVAIGGEKKPLDTYM